MKPIKDDIFTKPETFDKEESERLIKYITTKSIKDYQESLNEIENGGSYEDLKGAITDMQELIYEYELVCKQLFFMKTEYDKLKKKYDDLKDDYTIARQYAINNILEGQCKSQ